MTIQTDKTTYTTNIELYLPEINLTITQDHETHTELKFKNIMTNSTELKDVRERLKEINNDLESNESNFFKQKYFIYPIVSNEVII